MSKQFVERRDGSLYIIESRVPLAVVVREFQNGESPEAIRSHFPTLSLEQVYGAIAFYLGNEDEVVIDLQRRERTEGEFAGAHPAPPELKQKLDTARRQAMARRS